MTRSARELLPDGVLVLERGWLSSNNVILCGREHAAIVDSGYWTHAEQTVALVQQAIGGRSLSMLVNTHLHSDHCGGNAALQLRFPGLETHIPPGLAGAVRRWDPVALTYEPTGQYCPPFHIEGLLQPDDAIELGDSTWQVHAAPGHDPHSVVLFEPVSRCLISADALWQNGFGVVFQELEGERAFEEVEATLELIERLDPLVVIPGHGSVFSDVGGALARARDRLRAYQSNPARHSAHAAKVLLKFKLLELQQVPLVDFLRWAETTPYLQIVRDRWFGQERSDAWTSRLVEDLIRSGAAARSGDTLLNA